MGIPAGRPISAEELRRVGDEIVTRREDLRTRWRITDELLEAVILHPEVPRCVIAAGAEHPLWGETVSHR